MFGPVVDDIAANTKATRRIDASDDVKNSANAAIAEPNVPICSARRRPSVLSERCPHTGLHSTRATAVVAITTPISPADSPRPFKNKAKNGKKAAIAIPNRTNSTWREMAGETSRRIRSL